MGTLETVRFPARLAVPTCVFAHRRCEPAECVVHPVTAAQLSAGRCQQHPLMLAAIGTNHPYPVVDLVSTPGELAWPARIDALRLDILVHSSRVPEKTVQPSSHRDRWFTVALDSNP